MKRLASCLVVSLIASAAAWSGCHSDFGLQSQFAIGSGTNTIDAKVFLDAGSGTGAVFTVNVAPTVASTAPSSRGQGATGQTVTVTGTGFVSGAAVTGAGSGLTIVKRCARRAAASNRVRGGAS